MNILNPKYPWCTGAPRPSLISNMDAEEAIISYYTAPICETLCKTAIIKVKGVTRLESRYLNDSYNSHLASGFMRDNIYVDKADGLNKYIFIFHNESFIIFGKNIEEMPGGESNSKNLSLFCNIEYDR